MAKQNTRRNRRAANRKNRRANRKSRRNQYGGQPASVNDNSMAGPTMQSMAQGEQYERINRNYHGGAYVPLVGGPYPQMVADPTILPEDLRASARVAPLDYAIKEVSGLHDPGVVYPSSGGARRHRKSRKANRKNRKASRKNRKASRKNRKASRKNRKSRRNYRGGAYSLENAAPFNPASTSGLLLPPAMEAKALSGMNAEWKLAEQPNAFAPGVNQ